MRRACINKDMAASSSSAAATASASLEREEARNELRESLLVAVSRVVEHEMVSGNGAFEQLDDGKLEVERQVVHMLTELLLQKSAILFKDMQYFAKHAKRSGINPDDVKLCFRRHTEILKKLQNFEEGLKQRNSNSKKRKLAVAAAKRKRDDGPGNGDGDDDELFR